jgi:SnoaL-like polyketide cyclase
MTTTMPASRATGAALGLSALIAALAGCSSGKSASQMIVDSLRAQEAQVATHLTRFDSLDFDVFSNQKWDRLHESHSADIQVHWPDGHTTTGIAQHIEDLKAMFVYAPDTKIQAHPVRFGSGEWTAVTGVMTGTFSHPMPLGGGKFIQPTGKAFSLPMATIGRWKDGVMVEEYLFWDNQTYMKQIGLAHD